MTYYGHLEVFFPAGEPKTFVLDGDNIGVGRSTGNAICLNTNTISRYHLLFTRDKNGQVFVTDLESANGTFVDGKQLAPNQPLPLRGGEELQIGELRLIYQADQPAPAGAPEAAPQPSVTPPPVPAVFRELPTNPGSITVALPLSPAARARPHDAFLSYSRRDSDVMRRVQGTLHTAGVRVWVDEQGLEPGTMSWKQAIQQAIEQASCLVVILSPDSKQSRWVQAELDYAESQSKKIFPILARGDKSSAVPFGYTMAQWVDIQTDYDGEINKLVIAVRKFLSSI